MKTQDFESLITKWQGQGLVTQQQASQMITELNNSSSEDSGKKFIYTIGIVGGLALSAGILLMIASNWSTLGKFLQLILAILMPIVPISLAYYLMFVKQSQSIWGKALNLLGMFLIGGSLSMIGQIYNLESGYAGLLSIWTILSAFFVVVFKREENVAFTALCAGVAIFTLITENLSLYSDEQAIVLTLTVSALFYAGLLFSIGNTFRSSVVWKDSARALRLLSASVATGTLFFITFEYYARLLTDSGYQDSGWIPLSILFNIIFIAFMVFVLMRAFKYQEERVAMNAVRLLGIYLIVKYFTLFSDMLDTGLLMTVGGLLFIIGAWYLEKNKHQLMSMMRKDEPLPPSAFTPHQTQNYE